MDSMYLQKNKIELCLGREQESIEIGRKAVEAGLLKKLPGPSLPVFIFLLTRLQGQRSISITPEELNDHLPQSPQEIRQGLHQLSRQGLIEVKAGEERNYQISFYLEKFSLNDKSSPDDSPFSPDKLRQEIIQKNHLSRQDICKAMFTFLPEDENPAFFRDEIEQWLDEFELPLLQELIRRVDKWMQKNPYRKSGDAYPYMKKIINDWYKKEIYDLDKLKYYDNLYRETKKLAAAYGINSWKNVDSAQMKTFKSWIDGKNGLSFEVARFAIQEAARRKRDGEPSLKYIEDNFIQPWKNAKIRTIEEAKQYLNKKQYSNRKKETPKANHEHKKQKKNKKDYKWEDFFWNFDDFKET